jgi:hypothetical protein
MTRYSFALLSFALAAVASSCALPEKQKKPVPPPSNASNMPWNVPQAGQGMGQFGMMPQMQQRR